MSLKVFRANSLVKEFAIKVGLYKKTTSNYFLNLKEQLTQCLSAISSGVQQTVVNEAIDKNGDDLSRLEFTQRNVILNISSNIVCNMSYL